MIVDEISAPAESTPVKEVAPSENAPVEGTDDAPAESHTADVRDHVAASQGDEPALKVEHENATVHPPVENTPQAERPAAAEGKSSNAIVQVHYTHCDPSHQRVRVSRRCPYIPDSVVVKRRINVIGGCFAHQT